jgi:hypothetical protein
MSIQRNIRLPGEEHRVGVAASLNQLNSLQRREDAMNGFAVGFWVT